MPVRRLVGVPPRRTGPSGPAIPVGPDRARTPRCLGAGVWLRGFQGGDLLRQRLGVVSGVVAVRGHRGGRADEQPRGTDPALGCSVAKERLRLSQRRGVPVRGADADGGPDAATAETSGAGLLVSCDRSSSGRPSRSATIGPTWGLNGYRFCRLGLERFTDALGTGAAPPHPPAAQATSPARGEVGRTGRPNTSPLAGEVACAAGR